jgi:hypothetical protein
VKLEASNVEKVFAECINDDGSNRAQVVTIAGLTGDFTFFKLVLDQWENDIIDMLRQLPEAFTGKDSGDTYLNLCYNREKLRWTVDNATMEKLIVLGIAIGKAAFYLPKKTGDSFQINMPYVVIKGV